MPESESASQQGKKVVVKIGTSSLIHENGELKITEITALAEVLSQLRKQGYQILLFLLVRLARA
ncbi:hypothetical protein PUF88_04900 [Lactobacillaceae bacterium L1_55_11]|nr:hypothetical protein [Lactobacillaceae bacterium L1_55_11]